MCPPSAWGHEEGGRAASRCLTWTEPLDSKHLPDPRGNEKEGGPPAPGPGKDPRGRGEGAQKPDPTSTSHLPNQIEFCLRKQQNPSHVGKKIITRPQTFSSIWKLLQVCCGGREGKARPGTLGTPTGMKAELTA